jgi:hypothetical protein
VLPRCYLPTKTPRREGSRAGRRRSGGRSRRGWGDPSNQRHVARGLNIAPPSAYRTQSPNPASSRDRFRSCAAAPSPDRPSPRRSRTLHRLPGACRDGRRGRECRGAERPLPRGWVGGGRRVRACSVPPCLRESPSRVRAAVADGLAGGRAPHPRRRFRSHAEEFSHGGTEARRARRTRCERTGNEAPGPRASCAAWSERSLRARLLRHRSRRARSAPLGNVAVDRIRASFPSFASFAFFVVGSPVARGFPIAADAAGRDTTRAAARPAAPRRSPRT